MSDRCTRIVHKALAVVRPQFRLHVDGGIHGLPHWSRVWFHGRALAAAVEVDPAVLAWFAFLHDSQRHNDGPRPRHGARAADFAVRLRRDGVIDELDAAAFERRVKRCAGTATATSPATPRCRPAGTPTGWTWRRVGIVPHPARLCTPHTRAAPRIGMAVRMAQGLPRQPARL